MDLRDRPIEVAGLPSSNILYIKSSHSEKFTMDMMSWPFSKICWVVAGSGKLEYENGTSIDFLTGDVLYILPHIEHRFVDEKGDPCTLSIVCYLENIVTGRDQDLYKVFVSLFTRKSTISLADPWRWNYAHKYFNRMLIEQTNKSFAYQEVLISSFMEFLVFLVRSANLMMKSQMLSSSHRLINNMVTHLEANFINEVKLEELAQMSQMSSRNLTRHFKQVTGKTIVEYVTQLRINYACERLQETRQITFSAYDSGFHDLSFFYRVFKKYKGMTPKEFIRQTSLKT
jgi:AraC-like DNA-binding protein